MDEQIESKTATILRLRINNEFDTYFYNIKVKEDVLLQCLFPQNHGQNCLHKHPA